MRLPADEARAARRRATGAVGAAAALASAACGRTTGSRRRPALAQLPPVASLATVEVAPGCGSIPASQWGADLPPKGPIGPETVKFLLVHHTASSNNVPDPRAIIRQTYAFHTGPQKRWPDICYHFMIGPDGSIWETAPARSPDPSSPTRPAATRATHNSSA